MTPGKTVSHAQPVARTNPAVGGENLHTGHDVTSDDVTHRQPGSSGRRAVGAPTLDVMPKANPPADVTPAPDPVSTLLTVAEVAAVLRIDRYTVRRYIAAGQLPGVRIGRELRIERPDLARFIASRAIR